MSTPILIYNDAEEPVTQAILKNFKVRGISTQNLIGPNLKVEDQLSTDKRQVRWYFEGEGLVTEESPCIIRILDLPISLFENFGPDADYARQEVYSWVLSSLSCFAQKIGTPHPLGLSGPVFSLPEQWERILSLKLSGLRVPNYFLGDINHCSSYNDNSVFSSSYRFGHWRPGRENMLESSNLIFQRPQGIPVFAFSGSQNSLITGIEGDTPNIDSYTLELLKHHSSLIVSLFGYSFAEILFFVDGNEVTFGLMHPSCQISYKHPMFLNTIKNEIESKFA